MYQLGRPPVRASSGVDCAQRKRDSFHALLEEVISLNRYNTIHAHEEQEEGEEAKRY
jgi:hypothetical protein